MKVAPIPDNEVFRLNSLRRLDVLDTDPEERFDSLTRIAKSQFGVQTALVSLVDAGRQWFKSRQGLDATETPRDISFCAHAILGDDVFVVENAAEHPDFADNPLVAHGPCIRFYAGAPLHAPDGNCVGTLCVIDPSPRTLALAERQMLRHLADCVESELALRVARREQFFLHSIADALPGLIAYWDKSLRCRFANASYMQWFGRTPESLYGETIQNLLGPDLFTRNEQYILGALAGNAQHFERTLTKADGSTGYTIADYIPDLDENGAAKGFFVLVTDVTPMKLAERQLQETQDKLTAVLENVLDGIVRTDTYGTIQKANQAAERIFGYENGELLGQNVRILMPEPDRSRHDGYMAAHQVGKQTSVIGKGRELEGVTKDGRRFPLELTVTEAAVGGQRMFVGVVRDITERKLAQEQLRRLAETDALTGLPNRGKFDRVLVDEWQRHTRVGDDFSLILLDVDHFKQFNDTYGHQAGDACLKAVAGAIRSAVIRTTDFAARYGGEEFVCILPATSGEGAAHIAERIREAVVGLGIPHAKSTAADLVTVSLGVVSVLAGAKASATETLALADTQLYEAKKAGRNRWLSVQIGLGDAMLGTEGE